LADKRGRAVMDPLVRRWRIAKNRAGKGLQSVRSHEMEKIVLLLGRRHRRGAWLGLKCSRVEIGDEELQQELKPWA
jgi:hypothetical protein